MFLVIKFKKWKGYQWMFQIRKHTNEKKNFLSNGSGYKINILKSVVILMHPYYPK